MAFSHSSVDSRAASARSLEPRAFIALLMMPQPFSSGLLDPETQLVINETTILWGGFTLFILIYPGHARAGPRTIPAQAPRHRDEGGPDLVRRLGRAGDDLQRCFSLFHERGAEEGLELSTGFLAEKSLSIDNVFIFILIFSYFRVPATYQPAFLGHHRCDRPAGWFHRGRAGVVIACRSFRIFQQQQPKFWKLAAPT